MVSLTIPSRVSRIDFINNNPGYTYQYCTSLVQSSSNNSSFSPWFPIETEYIPNQLELSFASLPGFSAITSPFNWVLEIEFLDGTPLSE